MGTLMASVIVLTTLASWVLVLGLAIRETLNEDHPR